MFHVLRTALLSVASLVLFAGSQAFAASHPNGILLVTIDTLRADRVGAYGARTVRTPALDRIASSGILFSNAYATVPLTLPSHLSILSGRLPVEHTVRTNDGYQLPINVPLVSETLRRSGYATAAFVGSAVLRSSTGISRGFDHYDDDMHGAGERRCGEVVDRALGWFSHLPTRDFFVWVHLNDPHLPYKAPAGFASKYPRGILTKPKWLMPTIAWAPCWRGWIV